MTHRAQPLLYRHWLLAGVLLLVVGLIFVALGPGARTAQGHGEGSPAACMAQGVAEVNPSDDGSGSTFQFTYTDPDGDVVTGVCIKSGSNMFVSGHSDVLGNGTFESGCYTVSGVGTTSVTVTRNFTGPECQGLSHLDFVTTAGPTPTPPLAGETETPTPTPSLGETPTPSPDAPLGVAGVSATPTPAVAGAVSAPREQAEALPTAGGPPDGGAGWPNALLLAAIAGLALSGAGLAYLRRRL